MKVSANGPMWMPPEVMAQFTEAVAEAHALLKELDSGTSKAVIAAVTGGILMTYGIIQSRRRAVRYDEALRVA